MEPLVENRLHRGRGEVAAADDRIVRLENARCRAARFGQSPLGTRRCGGLGSLSALFGDARLGAAPASEIVCGSSGGQTIGGACRDKIGGRGGARFERMPASEDVPGGIRELAGERGLGRVRGAVARLDVGVAPVPGAPGLLGGLDRGPAQRVGSGLRWPADALALAGLLDPRREAWVAEQLARREGGDVADLAGDRQREQFDDAGDGGQQLDALVAAGERSQLALERRRLAIEVVDYGEERGDRAPPDLRQTVLSQLPALPADAAQSGCDSAPTW
jgi:hypothetical protein